MTEAGHGPPSLRLTRRRVIRLVAGLVTLFFAVHLLLPQLGGLERTGEQLAHATWWLPLSVLALEAASFAAYGELVRTVLTAGGTSPARGLLQRTTLVGASLGKTLPGGSTTAAAMIVRTLVANGVDAPRATAGLAASGMLSSATLALLLPVAAAFALGSGERGGVVLGGMASAAVVVLAAGVLPLLARRPEQLAAFAERYAAAAAARGRLAGRLDPRAVHSMVERGAAVVDRLTRNRRVLTKAVGWALANWLLDLAVLVVIAVTLGSGTPLASLLLAYVVAQLVAAVPITPGGVGVVETAMVGVFVAAGAPVAAATTTVLGWRLVSHWLPIIAGLLLLPTVARGAPGAGTADPH